MSNSYFFDRRFQTGSLGLFCAFFASMWRQKSQPNLRVLIAARLTTFITNFESVSPSFVKQKVRSQMARSNSIKVTLGRGVYAASEVVEQKVKYLFSVCWW